ncbi:VOC family protein [Paenibacillus turpanensis]|uniref:VOC family protein n=1 Tax=Paenibacillus turpanensis TaxID=2689078 RepID=UPI00140B7091|nr:VOC family protein [Paenibacillus turpanensis]
MELFARIDCNFIPVRELEASVEWYTKKIGCKLMWIHGDYAALNVNSVHPEEGQANTKLGQAMVTLVQTSDFQPLHFSYQDRKHPVINLYTKDISQTHAFLSANEVEVSAINDFGKMQGFDFYDLNGHLIGVCSF